MITARKEEERLQKIRFWKKLLWQGYGIPVIIILLIMERTNLTGFGGVLALTGLWILLPLTPIMLIGVIILNSQEKNMIQTIIQSSEKDITLRTTKAITMHTRKSDKPYTGEYHGIHFEFKQGGLFNKKTEIIIENSGGQTLPENITIHGLTYEQKEHALFSTIRYERVGEARISDVGPLLREVEKHWQHI